MVTVTIEEIQKTEIEWCEGDASSGAGLRIAQFDIGGQAEDGAIWIPAGHVAAFAAAIQSITTKR